MNKDNLFQIWVVDMWKGLLATLRLNLLLRKLKKSPDPFDRLKNEVIKALFRDGMSFKEFYFNHLHQHQQVKVKKVLLWIVEAEDQFLLKENFLIHMAPQLANACADLQIYEAAPEFKKMVDNPKYEIYRKQLKHSLEFFEIKLSKDMRAIFTEPFKIKTSEEYDQFIEKYTILPSDQQASVQQALLDLIRGQSISFAARAARVYIRINPERAKEEIERIKSDPRWKDFIGFLPSLD